MQDAPQAPVHVALVAESRGDGDLAVAQIRFAQQPRGAPDAHPRGRFQNTFADGLSICRSQPRRVPIGPARCYGRSVAMKRNQP